jgi:nitrite reductase/ring-hydroxylating ferredoxin subunit
MTMSQTERLCRASDVPAGAALRVSIPGEDPIAVCQIDGRFFAIADTCTHGMASLSEGEIEGKLIFCPFHGGSFDIETGAPVDRPCTIALRTYVVEERDGEVFLVRQAD